MMAGLAIMLVAAALASAEADHNCRFWACASEAIPDFVITEHLTSLPNSIENLSRSNEDGWSLAYYSLGSAAPTVHRGKPPAWQDAGFDSAVAEAARRSPQIAVSHIRACSSGLCEIPNPHPFERVKDGKHWLMGHNGTISKQVLLDLIRPEYLEANPPQYGSNPSEWIDTDLYFIYMLQTIEDHNWQVKPAIGEVIEHLREAIPGDSETFNFFLTDGTTVWAYRQGNTLYYVYDPATPSARRGGRPRAAATVGTAYSAVASQFPSASQGIWQEMANGDLVTLTPSSPPVLETVETYFPRPAR
ncbi:MAG TPA: class II glutamine amidotransferase [bacterium]|nr:class II glutamine amidotransferase [bacterium]